MFYFHISFRVKFDYVVEQPVSNHLSAQGRPDPRGGLGCFCVQRKFEPLLLAHRASGTLKIIKTD